MNCSEGNFILKLFSYKKINTIVLQRSFPWQLHPLHPVWLRLRWMMLPWSSTWCVIGSKPHEICKHFVLYCTLLWRESDRFHHIPRVPNVTGVNRKDMGNISTKLMIVQLILFLQETQITSSGVNGRCQEVFSMYQKKASMAVIIYSIS